MAEINIIKIDGKPLEKLIDVISKGIGTIYKPRAIRNEADSEAYKIELIERAKNKALAEGREIEAESIDRVQERLIHKELKRQTNIDKVTQIAAEQINNEQQVSDEPVDEDWTTRFFNIIEDVSNEEMQNLWGRILAGEVVKPKTYSLRTLELLKNIGKTDAECFMKFGKLAVKYSNTSFIINFNNDTLLENKYNLTFGERLLLEELGLINALDLQFKVPGTNDKNEKRVFTIGKTCVVAELEPNIPEQKINVLVFTKIGQELLQLIESITELDYIQLLTSKIRRKGVNVKYAQIKSVTNGNISHTGLIEVPFTEEEIKKEEERSKKEEEKLKREEEKIKREAERQKKID
jgi:uncharacterized repeat protein (TIGR03899 family)